MEETVETQRVGFSSENFKIEINNLPKFFSVGQAKKLLKNKLQLNPHKFKPVGKNAKYMFVNFANEEDRNQAIEKLNGFQLKGNKLRAFAANAAKDPLSKIKDEKEDTRPVTERIADAVCGLHNMDYEKQLESKLTEIETIAKNLRREYVKQLPVLKFDDVAEVKPFLPSPVVNGYRNKCEFTIGRHPETNEITIGFRLASYKKGSIAVVEADHLPIVSDQMKQIIKYFQSFVRESGYDAYNHINMQGHWRQLTVRTNRKGDAMVWAILHPQSMSQEQKDDLAKGIRDHFNSDKTAGILDRPISSLYLQFLGQREKGAPDPPIQLLTGEPSISETLVDGKLKFEISPQSFFQVNVEGAEKLYSKCAELANLNKENTVLFDVCCGTGTIGLCLADKCLKVIGVDIVEEAIENAKKNAKANNIDNAEYHAGRAEFVLPELLKQCEDSNAVAVVDPPRAGLHPKAVQALRASANIKTLVYVSCDAKAAMQSLVALGRPPSNTFQGDPFVPKQIVPVDLFPHTKHFELVIFFERLEILGKDNKP